MKFKDVTKRNPDLVNAVSIGNDFDTVKVFENGDSLIIYTSDEMNDHASISNKSRHVKESEIDYAVKQIIRTRPENVAVQLGNGGIIHVYRYKEKQIVH